MSAVGYLVDCKEWMTMVDYCTLNYRLARLFAGEDAISEEAYCKPAVMAVLPPLFSTL